MAGKVDFQAMLSRVISCPELHEGLDHLQKDFEAFQQTMTRLEDEEIVMDMHRIARDCCGFSWRCALLACFART